MAVYRFQLLQLCEEVNRIHNLNFVSYFSMVNSEFGFCCTDTDSQLIPVYKTFDQIRLCGNE